MADKAWKRREREAARRFGTLRNIGSGSQGRAEKSNSDTIHDKLYIEVKCRKKHTVITLYDDTKSKAIREHKIPVVMLAENGRPGFWVLVHEKHLQQVAEEMAGKSSSLSTGGATNGMANNISSNQGTNIYSDPLGRTT